MNDAPEKIWATGNKTTGSWNHTPLSLRIAPLQTEYTRTDIADARIDYLEYTLTTISFCIQQWNDAPVKTGTEILLRLVKSTCDEALEDTTNE
tara:strand:- start:285 stop:563 length:279 start_codon:yes stop_codon:yes gene_type:complete